MGTRDLNHFLIFLGRICVELPRKISAASLSVSDRRGAFVKPEGNVEDYMARIERAMTEERFKSKVAELQAIVDALKALSDQQ